MKNTARHAIAAVSAGLALTLGLVGCASASTGESATRTQTAVPTPTVEISTVSLATTCDQLFGTDFNGPFLDGNDIISRILDVPDLSTITVDEVRVTVEALEGAQRYAADRWKPFIGEIITPLASLLDMMVTGDQRDIPFHDYAAAGHELLKSCKPYLTESSEPATPPTPAHDSDADGVADSADDFPTDPTRTEQLSYPSGDAVRDGYPLIVDSAQIDYRVAHMVKTPQVVALAPGVYAGYNPAATDLSLYFEGPTVGDCAVREMYGFQGGACWDGVLASPAEPAI